MGERPVPDKLRLALEILVLWRGERMPSLKRCLVIGCLVSPDELAYECSDRKAYQAWWNETSDRAKGKKAESLISE